MSIRKNNRKSIDENAVVLNEVETNSIEEINTEVENEDKNEITQKNELEDLDQDDNIIVKTSLM